jgi:hypothetical protein
MFKAINFRKAIFLQKIAGFMALWINSSKLAISIMQTNSGFMYKALSI